MLELANTGWIAAHRNVLFTGPTGIGKEFVAYALGDSAACIGYIVLHARAPRLFETSSKPRRRLSPQSPGQAIQGTTPHRGLPAHASLGVGAPGHAGSCRRPLRCWRHRHRQASAPFLTGTRLSTTLPWPRPYATGSCTMPTGSRSRAKLVASKRATLSRRLAQADHGGKRCSQDKEGK